MGKWNRPRFPHNKAALFAKIWHLCYNINKFILGGNITSKEDFFKRIDARDFKHEEEIDGVRVVHTGMTASVHKGYRSKFSGRHEDLGYEEEEILEMYDANGNRFYSNCSSLEEAEKLVAKLKEEGKDAVIGPKAPWRGQGGKIIRNGSKDAVGVYIVKQKEEKEVETEKEPSK